MTNVEKVAAARDRHSRFVIDSSFVIRLPRRSRAEAGHSSFSARSAFTLIELVVVVGIILILAGLVLSTAGYARKKGARARAETEIAAMSAALESYKADNATYVRNTDTDGLDAQTSGNPCAYRDASLYLYKQLSGDTNANFQPPAGAKSYFTFKPNMLGTSPTTTTDACGNTLTPTTVSYIRDPFGNIYGYSTIQETGTTTQGYNPTFDLWSTNGLTSSPPTAADRNQWIKNW
jgi:prepilin-type N-terminal cleavage/methylation domain-containing protein